MLKTIATAILWVGLLGSVVGYAEEAQPSFEGKSMSQWMTLLKEVPNDPAHASQDWRKAPWALGKIGVPALPDLITTLQDPNPSVRLRAIRTIVAMGKVASDAAPGLAQCLKDSDPRVRQWAAVALGQIGPAAAGGGAALIGALKDPEPSVRQASAAALGAIGTQEAIEPLQAAATDANLAVQRAARLALEKLQPAKP
jgi:HEAT repeat protein